MKAKINVDEFITANLFENLVMNGRVGPSYFGRKDFRGFVCGPVDSRDASSLERYRYGSALKQINAVTSVKHDCSGPCVIIYVSLYQNNEMSRRIMVRADCLPLVTAMAESVTAMAESVTENDDLTISLDELL